MTKADCKTGHHYWNVGAGFSEKDISNIEEGIFVWCQFCDVRRKAKFNKPIRRKKEAGR